MCDHFLGLHRYELRHPKAVWRCGTCGRESYQPVDCCVQPYFTPKQHPSLVGIWVTWTGDVAGRALTGAIAWFRRRRLSSADVDTSLVQPVHVEEHHIDRTEVEANTPVAV